MPKFAMTPYKWAELLDIGVKVVRAIRDHLREGKRGRKRRRKKKHN